MNIKVSILLFAILITILTACKGDGDLPPVVITTNLNVINAGTDTVNFYQDGTRINNTSNLYPFGTLGYLLVAAGQQNYQFKKAGSSNTLVNIPLTLTASGLYTLFLAGETADQAFLLKDSLNSLISNTDVRIRFVNASPISGTLDVSIGNTFNYKNLAFKSATPYVEVSSGANTLAIYQSGSTTPLTPSGTLTLAAGFTYTLFTKGVLNGTGNSAFGARIVTSQ
jgi:hypothetical protein